MKDEIGHPLSCAQEHIYLAQQLEPTSSAYKIAYLVEIRGGIDARIFQEALRRTAFDVDALRLRITAGTDGPRQVIDPVPTWGISFVDLRGEEDFANAIEAWIRPEMAETTSIIDSALFKHALFEISSNCAFWYSQSHHIALDGFGGSLALGRVAEIYSALVKGEMPKSSEFRSSIFLQEQEANYRTSERFAIDERFWRDELAGGPNVARLASPLAKSPEMDRHKEMSLSTAEMGRVVQQASRVGVTVPQFITGVMAAYVHRLSGQQDFVLGFPVTGRIGALSRLTPGMASNILPLRLTSTARTSLGELMQRTGTQIRRGLRHQGYRGEHLWRGLGSFRPAICVNCMPQPQNLKFGNSIALPRVISYGSREDFSIAFAETCGGDLQIDFLSCYPAEQLDGHSKAFVGLLKVMSEADPKELISGIELLSASEREQILVEWNNTAQKAPEGTLPMLFEAQVERSPDATALILGRSSISYQELNVRANRLAHQLIAQGVGAEDRVAIALPRSLEMISSLLGILKAGAAYVPLDPDYPAERLALMLEDAHPKCVMTTAAIGSQLPGTVPQFYLDQAESIARLESLPGVNPDDAIRLRPLVPKGAAYVIYTSGSTGKPKGVVITHENVLGLFCSTMDRFDFGPEDVWTLFHSYAFDFSVWELWGPLLKGGRLVVVPYLTSRSPAEFLELLVHQQVTVLNQTPSAFYQLMNADEENEELSKGLKLRYVIFGGEALQLQRLKAWYERHNDEKPLLVNMYGITETTVHASYMSLDEGNAAKEVGSLIGSSIPGLQLYVLDGALQPMPIGVSGELYIGGVQLARGYLNRPGLTAERFVPNPVGERGSRLYRTGDLGRWRTDGVFEFLGRVDDQVKIRGFRIELGEIEAALSEHPAIAQVAVVVREDKREPEQLVGYVVSRQGETVNGWQLRRYLTEKLPEYMVPRAFVTLGRLPMTPSGKLDRKALPNPEGENSSGNKAPRSATEYILCNLFSEVLAVEQIGIEDSFFDLGGHSLLATQLVTRIRKTLGVELPLRAIFETPQVSELSRCVEALKREDSGLKLPPLMIQPRPKGIPLSFAQERLWIIEQSDSLGGTYNIPVALRLEGEMNVEATRLALNEIVRRHESLRTRFESCEGRPVQVIEQKLEIQMKLEDLSGLTETEQRKAVEAALKVSSGRPFDLNKAPLLRVEFLRLGPSNHIALLTMHHIVSDGWSMGVLVEELSSLYASYANGQGPKLAELTLQYADYALWQRSWLNNNVLEQLKYWTKQLKGASTALELPTDRLRPRVRSFRGAGHSFAISQELSAKLNCLARSENVTPFMLFLAAYQLLLGRWGNQDDVLVGSPIAGRTERDSEQLIGFFVNLLVLRTKLWSNQSFRQLLAQVRETTLEAYTHQDLPFERLVEAIQAKPDSSRQPLFQAEFGLQNAPIGKLELPGLHITRVDVEDTRAKFDISLFITQTKDGFEGQLVYATDLFERATIQRLASSFEEVLKAVAQDPDRLVGLIEVVPPDQRRQILVEWNGVGSEYRNNTCVHELFTEQARRTPEAVALTYGRQELSYRELDERSDQLARYLSGVGVKPDVVVGICVGRSPLLVIGLLGILKAGGAYLPLDPISPSDRLAFMLDDAKIPIVLCDAASSTGLPDRQGQNNILLDTGWHKIVSQGLHSVVRNIVTDRNVAYVIYTSGSTGKPKGVLVEHRSIVNYLNWAIRHYVSREARSTFPFFTGIDFDLSVTAIYLPLIGGAEMKIYSQDASVALERLVADEAIDTVKLTPAHLAILSNVRLENAKITKLVVGGEMLKTGLANSTLERLRTEATIYNEYGPTEATVGCIVYRYEKQSNLDDSQVSIPIGRPISNTEAYVLDGNLNVAPAGVTGELYLSGRDLARGYLKQPGLTAEKFIANPFCPGHRMYRSGDLARWRADGNLEFLGRMDQQIKIRGFRVEPGEVEATLTSHSAVTQAAVMLRQDQLGQNHLVGYFVPIGGDGIGATELREYLSQKLPYYMLPSALVRLSAMPLTANGKLDRRALPDPYVKDSGFVEHAFCSEHEQILCSLCAETLGIEKVCLDDNFIELGGDSISLIRLVASVRKVFGVELPLATAFEAPSVRQLADHIATLKREGFGFDLPPLRWQSRPEKLPLSFAQERLWILEQLEPLGATYNGPAAVRLDGELDVAALRAAVNEIVARHESLRTRFESRLGEPVQVIEPGFEIDVPLEDVSALPEREQTRLLDEVLNRSASEPFDLGQLPLMRARLIRVRADRHVLLFNMHHIVSDGWSISILIDELSTFYTAYRRQQVPQLERLAVQYADFALWQRSWLKGDYLQKQLDYWIQQLAGAPAVLELPTDRARPAMRSFRGLKYPVSLPRELSDGLKTLAKRQSVTPFMVLLASFQLSLSQWGNQDDVLVGCPIANRRDDQTQKLIGFFANTLVLRAKITPRLKFREFLAEVRKTTLDAYTHQDLPFERLVEALRPNRESSHQPIFQAMFVLQNVPRTEPQLPGLRLQWLETESYTAKFDLNLSLSDTDAGFCGFLEYANDLFDSTSIERFAQRFLRIVEQAVDDPDRPLAQLDVLSREEQELILLEGSQTTASVEAMALELMRFDDEEIRTGET